MCCDVTQQQICRYASTSIVQYPRQLGKLSVWSTLIVSGYLRGECYSPAGRKNITRFNGDPLSGAMAIDDIQVYQTFQMIEERFAHLNVEVQSAVRTCDNHHLYVLII